MRIAVLADIHGNLPALEAVLAEVDRERPDLVVVCGDVASGPMPVETIELLRNLRAARFVRGNADRELVQAYDGKESIGTSGPSVNWCAAQLSREHRDFLAEFEDTITVHDDNLGRVVFCHGSPRSDVEIMTAESTEERLRELTSATGGDLVVCGHTHMQFDRMAGSVRVVNPGSVGMPYGKVGASWASLDQSVRMRHTDYDLGAAANRIRATGWPQADEFASENVLKAPSVEEALELMRTIDAWQRGIAPAV